MLSAQSQLRPFVRELDSARHTYRSTFYTYTFLCDKSFNYNLRFSAYCSVASLHTCDSRADAAENFHSVEKKEMNFQIFAPEDEDTHLIR